MRMFLLNRRTGFSLPMAERSRSKAMYSRQPMSRYQFHPVVPESRYRPEKRRLTLSPRKAIMGMPKSYTLSALRNSAV